MTGASTRLALGLVAALAVGAAGADGAVVHPTSSAGQAATAERPLAATRSQAIDQLIELIARRLEVSIEVARTKWNTKAPIEDLVREADVIAAAADRASAHGLPRELVAEFFRAQIEASKRLQQGLHAEWRERQQRPFDQVADLAVEVRPVLDRLTPALLEALRLALPLLARPGDGVPADVEAWSASPRFAGLRAVAGGTEAVRVAVAPLLVRK